MSLTTDLRKEFKHFYSAKPGKIVILDIPSFKFMKTTGKGKRSVYAIHDGDEIWSISRVVNRLKEITKNEMDFKFKLMPLEVNWNENENEWEWETLMHVPELIDEALFQRALLELEQRNRSVRVPVEFVTITQGLSVQGLHIGPYETVEETEQEIKEFCNKEGYQITSPRREIYINQPFCNPPEKYQTIVRFSIEKIN